MVINSILLYEKTIKEFNLFRIGVISSLPFAYWRIFQVVFKLVESVTELRFIVISEISFFPFCNLSTGATIFLASYEI